MLTKPIGTGILSTALKQGAVTETQAREAIGWMAKLNRSAADAMRQSGANACTDVTGFGLLGHLLGMMRASDVSAVIYANTVPQLGQAFDLAAGGILPGGSKNNFEFTAPFVAYSKDISKTLQYFLNDAQTSGGLLISLPQNQARQFLQTMQANSELAVVIGKVIEKQDYFIRVETAMGEGTN